MIEAFVDLDTPSVLGAEGNAKADNADMNHVIEHLEALSCYYDSLKGFHHRIPLLSSSSGKQR
jgi:hypothetical protein